MSRGESRAVQVSGGKAEPAFRSALVNSCMKGKLKGKGLQQWQYVPRLTTWWCPASMQLFAMICFDQMKLLSDTPTRVAQMTRIPPRKKNMNAFRIINN